MQMKAACCVVSAALKDTLERKGTLRKLHARIRSEVCQALSETEVAKAQCTKAECQVCADTHDHRHLAGFAAV